MKNQNNKYWLNAISGIITPFMADVCPKSPWFNRRIIT